MKRIAFLLAALAGAVAFLVTTGAGGGSGGPKYYWVELDNAFGLITGADVKVAGVRAGKIGSLKLDRKTKRALVDIEITQTGFGSFRKDVHCESRPQSLIGEYFVDCQPGHGQAGAQAGRDDPGHPDRLDGRARPRQRHPAPALPRAAADHPQRARAPAWRGAATTSTRRCGARVPALRETDKVLAILARQNQVLKNLATNGDRVITALANNKRDVGRFVAEARDTAQASAERRVELAATFHKLPGFLEQLQPTMRQLSRVADAQTPALRDLNASAGQLQRFFNNLGPFSNASQGLPVGRWARRR